MVEREWKDGDVVVLRLPMRVTVKTWVKNHKAVSVNYGPLTFSLKIGENWTRYGGTDAWPEWEVSPTTSWNYGLVLNERDPARSFQLIKSALDPSQGGELGGQVAVRAPRPGGVGGGFSQSGGGTKGGRSINPFTAQAVPIALTAKAKKIPAWKLDRFGLVARLQDSPVKSDEPTVTVTLVPMGAARLRISAFPVIGTGRNAHEWIEPKTPPVSASHCFEQDCVEAFQYDFEIPSRVSTAEMYGSGTLKREHQPVRMAAPVGVQPSGCRSVEHCAETSAETHSVIVQSLVTSAATAHEFWDEPPGELPRSRFGGRTN
jgi:hypothetical protein